MFVGKGEKEREENLPANVRKWGGAVGAHCMCPDFLVVEEIGEE